MAVRQAVSRAPALLMHRRKDLQMLRRLPAYVLSLALIAPAAGYAQTLGTPTDVVSEVIGLAPQLVAFAGSDANFRNLVTGLNQGAPVSLVTATPDGLTQTVTFTPSGVMSATDIARTLESARQQLISRGVAAPSALQIGTTLVGGALPTPAGTVQVNPVLAQPGAVATLPNASTGATAPPLGAAPAGTGTTGTPASPGVVFSGPNPIFTSTPAPATTNPSGPPSPAVQMQGHR
jgi:hypothetical protein